MNFNQQRKPSFLSSHQTFIKYNSMVKVETSSSSVKPYHYAGGARGRIKIFFLLLALLIFFGNCAYYNTLFNAKKNFNEGLKVLRENPNTKDVPRKARSHFETTIEKCWKLIELYSDKSKYADDALLLIAKSEFNLGKYSQAKLHLTQFLQKYPDSELTSEAHLWLGKVLLREDSIEEANEHFLIVITTAKNPQIRSQASFELGVYAFENERYEEAINYLNKALKEKLDDQYKARVLFYLGESYYIQGDYKKAVENFQKALKYSPTLDIEYKLRLHLAEAFSLMGKYEKAYEELHKMLTAPRFKDFTSFIKTAMAKNYEREGRLEEALELYREVVQKQAKNAGTALAAYNLARIYETVRPNLDSAVVYYGLVNKIYSKFDSVEVARQKAAFLSEIKEIRDNIRRDEKLVYRLTHDPEFRDSLYQAQYEDSLRRAQGIPQAPVEEIADTMNTLLPTDSLKTVAKDTTDSLQTTQKDTVTEQNEDDFMSFRKQITEEEKKKAELEKQEKEKLKQQTQQTPAQKNKPLEKRKLPQIEFDLMNHRYHLAEFFLLKEENYDSAAVYFEKFLKMYEDSILTPKALYSLVYIYKSPGHENPQLVDSLEKEIVAQYPNSIFAREILKSKGLYKEEEQADPQEAAHQLFLKAESLYFSGDYPNALRVYKQVAKMDTTWEICAKAQYAIAWIYENDLSLTDSAFTAYQKIIDNYPSATSYVQVARKKITPPVETPKPSTPVDSSAVQGEPSPTEGKPGEILPTEDATHMKDEDILEEKIRWRRLRTLRE
ncbi:MAG: tetratricopeptide repeat protein [Calditrichaeota bacterium]|nr:MAG: tetratricopeptide repeat protein [Calditrichota bacterium]